MVLSPRWISWDYTVVGEGARLDRQSNITCCHSRSVRADSNSYPSVPSPADPVFPHLSWNRVSIRYVIIPTHQYPAEQVQSVVRINFIMIYEYGQSCNCYPKLCLASSFTFTKIIGTVTLQDIQLFNVTLGSPVIWGVNDNFSWKYPEIYQNSNFKHRFCVACEAKPHIRISLCPASVVCLSGSHTFLVVRHSYVSQATHAFLRMLPLCSWNFDRNWED